MSTAPVKPIPAKAARPRRATPVASAKAVPAKVASVKAPAKTPAKPASQVAKVAPKPVPTSEPRASIKPVSVKPAKPVKVKKPKLMRDSFTIPKTEYAVLRELKQRAAKLTRTVKKSELIRAGIKTLAALPDVVFMNALMAVSAVTPRGSKKTKAKGG